MRPLGSRRLVAACLVAALLPAGGATAAGGGEPEVQTQEYLYSHGVDTWHYTVSGKTVLPPIVFTPRPQDRWLHIAAEDAAGYGVLVHVTQPDGKGGRGLREVFCGTANLYRLASTEPVEVHVYSGACPNHNFGFATSGTLTATFSPTR